MKTVKLLLMLLLISFSLSSCTSKEKLSLSPYDSSAYLLEAGNSLADDSFTFLYLGDTQKEPGSSDGYKIFGENLRQADQNKTSSFMIIGGDLVNDGNDPAEWEEFFAAGQEVFSRIPLLPAMGNHDNKKGYKDLFILPQNGPQNAKSEYYSFDFGSAHFTIGNSNNILREENLAWLGQDLAESKANWKIMVIHHPVYSATNNSQDAVRAEKFREILVPVFAEYGVALVLSGHQHLYARTAPLRLDRPDPLGTVYLTGVGGNKMYEADPQESFEVLKAGTAVHTFITVNNDAIKLETYTYQGELIDSYTIRKGE
ncbi:MAG: metallophosphoesterase [Clostridiales bacterium]|nr:metallophosphoesterase [Clostridiales bacterium]